MSEPTDIKHGQNKVSVEETWNNIQQNVIEDETKKKENFTRTKETENIKETTREVRSTPTMVFSVIGDSDSFVPKPWPKTVFQTALIEAAKSGGETWILYRGSDEDVSNVVSDAYQQYEDMEFGTKTSGISDPNRHVKLISIAGKKTEYSTMEKRKPTSYETNIGEGDSVLLEFEKFVSKQKVSFFNEKLDIEMSVPIAIIVCEGDIDTITHISEALKNKLPVIIMKGSGKAADLVSDYLDNPSVLRKKANNLFGIQFDDAKYNKLGKLLETISERREFIGVFDLDRDDPFMLSSIVGEAVVSCWSMENILPAESTKSLEKPANGSLENTGMKSSNSNRVRIKGFSLTWKVLRRNSIRPEDEIIEQILKGFKKESKTYVLNPKYSTPTSLPLYFYFGYQLFQESKCFEECGPILLFEALKANRCDYVRVLLSKGVKFDMNNLPELYSQTVACQDCKFKDEDCLHMQWILKQIKEKQASDLCQEHMQLMEEYLKAEDENEKKMCLKKMKGLASPVVDAAKQLCHSILRYKEYVLKEEDEKPEDENISNILLWAIFANRKELAEICWLRVENHLLTGLVCSAILKKLSTKANNVKEQILSNDLEEHSKIFEKRCIGIMDSMYNENSQHAIELMDDDAVVWGIRSSPLTFAYENFLYDVVAHDCSQKNMNRQWYNNLAPDLKLFFMSAFTNKYLQFLTAPLTRYIFNYMLFFLMLVMYSAIVLTSVSTEYFDLPTAQLFEYYLYIWGAGDFIEELISCFGCLEARGRSHRGYYSRMKRYLYDFWNVVDLLSYILLIAALFVRHFYSDSSFTIARRMFALSLLVMYLRFLEVFLVHRKMGPTLIMIKEMLKDLLKFLFIAVFVVFGIGIYYHANLWPDHRSFWDGNWQNWRVWTILTLPYWQLYGDPNLDSLDGSEPKNCSSDYNTWAADTSVERCSQEDWTVQAVGAIYMLFSNLLLVNLVIAMFSYTFERVQENSEKLWRFERYTVINDYEWRIPSPINLVFLPYRMCCQNRDNCCIHMFKVGFCKKRLRAETMERKTRRAYRRNFQKVMALRNHNKI